MVSLRAERGNPESLIEKGKLWIATSKTPRNDGSV